MAIRQFELDRVEDKLRDLAEENEHYWEMYCEAFHANEALEEENAELIRVLNVVWDAYSSILPNTRQALINQEPLLATIIEGIKQ